MRPSISSITASLIGCERPSSSRSWQAASHLSIQAGAANAAPGPADARAVTQPPSAGCDPILSARSTPVATGVNTTIPHDGGLRSLGRPAQDVRHADVCGDLLEKTGLPRLDSRLEAASSRVASGESAVENAGRKVRAEQAGMLAVARPEIETRPAAKRLR